MGERRCVFLTFPARDELDCADTAAPVETAFGPC
jgi:hypothetical protein